MKRPNPITTLLRMLLSLSLLLAVLVGLPVALVRVVGWPLPTSMPTLEAMQRGARSGISDELILNTLTVLAWLAWAQVALAVVAELVAAARRRPSRRVPILPGIQTGVARLIAGVTMFVATAHPTIAVATPFAAPAPVVAELHRTAPSVAPTSTTSAPAPAAATVTVERHDSYWAIAERTLGDGLRWRDVRDLNVGRAMTDGHVIEPGSDLLRPGWVLVLPSDAKVLIQAEGVLERPAQAESGLQSTEMIVARGDSLWSIAEAHVTSHVGGPVSADQVRPYWQSLIEVNRSRLTDPQDPNVLFAGQHLALPVAEAKAAGQATLAPSPTSPATPPAPPAPPASTTPSTTEALPETPPASPAPAPAPAPTTAAEKPTERQGTPVVSPAHAAPEDASDRSEVPTPVVVTVGALTSTALAVGAKRAIAARRRRMVRADPARGSRPTPEAQRPLHRQVVAAADEGSIADLAVALGGLAEDLAAAGSPARPRIVQHGSDHLDLYLAVPSTDAPRGWTVQADGAIWSFEPQGFDHEPPTDVCPAPLLVTLGVPDDDGQLYLDLEADGLVALVGDVDTARDLARSVITEVALGPLGDAVHVMVVGDLIGDVASRLDRVRVVDSWEDAATEVGAWAEQSHQALAEQGWPNPFIGRGTDPEHDALAALLVVAAKAPPSEVATALTGNRPSTVALVVADRFEGAATVIECHDDGLSVIDIGLHCQPQTLDEACFADLVALLKSAGPGVDQLLDEPVVAEEIPSAVGEDQAALVEPIGPLPAAEPDGAAVDHCLERVPGDRAGPEPEPEPEYGVLVRLLGEITVDAPKRLRPKATAVLAYIALHRSVSAETLEDACWSDPEDGPVRRRLKDTLLECRSAVGSTNLPHASGGRYTRGPGVITDTELFDLRVARAHGLPDADAADIYWSALELVTGKVFTYTTGRAASSYTWIDIENLVSQWEIKIASVAQRCAVAYLSTGRPERAVEVAVNALNALPLHKELTETLMRAHAATGNFPAVETVYRAHAEGLARIHHEDPAESTHQLALQTREEGGGRRPEP